MPVLPPSLYSNWWTAPAVLFAESTVLCVPRSFFFFIVNDESRSTYHNRLWWTSYSEPQPWQNLGQILYIFKLIYYFVTKYFCLCRCERERGGGIMSTCMQLHLTVSLYVEPIGWLDISPLVLFLWDRSFHWHKSIYYYPTSPRDLPISASHRACFLCVY